MGSFKRLLICCRWVASKVEIPCLLSHTRGTKQISAYGVLWNNGKTTNLSYLSELTSIRFILHMRHTLSLRHVAILTPMAERTTDLVSFQTTEASIRDNANFRIQPPFLLLPSAMPANNLSAEGPRRLPPSVICTELCRNIPARFWEWLAEILGHTAVLG